MANENLVDILSFYADPVNYDRGVPGEATLLGYEPDNGKRAQEGLALLQSLIKQRDQLKQRVKKLEEQTSSPRFIAGGSTLDLLLRTWLCTQQIPFFAQAWQGYRDHGRGAVVLTNRWYVDASNPRDELRYELMTRYLSCSQIDQIPEPYHSGVLILVNEYDPQHEAVLLFCGHDMSQKGKRHPFSLERNLFHHEIIQVEAGCTVPEFAAMLGVEQVALPEVAIDVEPSMESDRDP